MSEIQRRLAAIVFADIVGFSSRTQEDESAAMMLLGAFAELARPLLEAKEAGFVKSLGDGYLVAFSSVQRALEFSVELQSSVADHNARSEPSLRFEIRIGVHVGDVEFTRDDIFGDGVNIASRLHGFAEPGGICVSEDVYRQVRARKEWVFEALGVAPLKHIQSTVELFKLKTEGAGRSRFAASPDSMVSIAVLPFADFSPDQSNRQFCDGLSDEIITALSRFSRLRVISRTSSFALRGVERSMREIGGLLGAQVVVEGSVRQSGDRIRVAAQLIDVQSDTHLWSELYDRRFSDIGVLQEELTRAIVSALAVSITPEERQAMRLSGTSDVQAYELYLQGVQQYWRFSIPGLRAAKSLFKEAISLDPNFARAVFGLAQCAAYHFFFWGEPTMAMDARWAAERLAELAPETPETEVAQGLAHLLMGDYESARAQFEEAVALDPQCYDGWYALARCLFSSGRFAESILAYERAAEVRVDDYQALALAMVASRSAGDEERRVEIAARLLPKLRRHRQLHPDDPRAGYFEASVYTALGEFSTAVERLEHTLALGPNDPSILYNAACVYCLLQMHEQALDCLELATRAGFADRQWLEHDMDLRDIRSDPRFVSILSGTEANRRSGLATEAKSGKR